jgi:hypothetical protein
MSSKTLTKDNQAPSEALAQHRSSELPNKNTKFLFFSFFGDKYGLPGSGSANPGSNPDPDQKRKF